MQLNLIVVGAALAALASSPLVHAESSELEELKAQLRVLQEKVAQLERREQAAQPPPEQAVVTSATARPGVDERLERFEWKGDFRYRNETIDQELAAAERNRDRVRLRAGFAARVHDALRVELQVSTTENGDPRSANQTLSNANSRKAFDLSLAYAEWSPNESWRAIFGKMPYPWVRSGSYFFDRDVNPEGIALQWQQGTTGLFANLFHTYLMERGTQAESTMSGAQLGWRGRFGRDARLTLAASYFDHGAVEGYDAFHDRDPANAFGNSVTTDPAVCKTGIAACLANDYDIMELQADLAMPLAGRPLTLFVDYARNPSADFSNPAQSLPSGLDAAYAAGVQYGRVSGARSWEVGYIYQDVEKDALFGQWVDSNFAAGNTDGKGSVIRLGYGFAKGVRVNGTYFITPTNIDVPTSVAGVGAIRDRDYRRLQLDVNMSF